MCFRDLCSSFSFFNTLLAFFLLWGPLACQAPVLSDQGSKPMNVLFIAVDDLRPDLGAYGKVYMHTPNMDKLAAEGRLFLRHYVQVPTCGASRRALLTGRRPFLASHLNNHTMAQDLALRPETSYPESFAHHFRRNGYHTVAIGKVTHYVDGKVYTYEQAGAGEKELPYSWDEQIGISDEWGTAWNGFFGYAGGLNRTEAQRQVYPFEAADGPDSMYPDGRIAEEAISQLRQLKGKDQPFLLAVGFYKPHLPFTAPRKYWDLYERDSLPLPPVPGPPKGVDAASLHNSNELNGYHKTLEEAAIDAPLSESYSRLLRHAYAAAVSYADAQVGKVLDALEREGLADNTLVILWGDHGWHLGDQAMWGKHTLFERSLHSTLIVKTPQIPSPGLATRAIVETVDLYPTLTDLCGLPVPDSLDGQSLAPLLKDPQAAGKGHAYGYFKRGISVRNDRYRLTRYFREESPVVELYDHEKDPYESLNLADQLPAQVEALMPLLDKGNTGLYER